MNRMLICLLSICIFALPACGEDDDDSNTNGNNDNGISSETHAFVADYITDSIAFINTLNEVNCRCDYEDQNFETSDECLDEVIISSEQESAGINCLQDELDKTGVEPTQGHFDYFNCQLEVFEEYTECVDLSDEDLCIDATVIVRGNCLADFDEDLDACEADFLDDEEAQQWEETHDSEEADSCLDFL